MSAPLTDLERAALDLARAFIRAQSGPMCQRLDGTEAARSALSEAAREHARGLPDRASGDATRERALAVRIYAQDFEGEWGGNKTYMVNKVRQVVEAAWEAGRNFGRAEKR